jgi:hypothetical protein
MKPSLNWKKEPFAAGHPAIRARYLAPSFQTFLLLVAIHTSIFLVPYHPLAAIILLLCLIKGWLLA